MTALIGWSGPSYRLLVVRYSDSLVLDVRYHGHGVSASFDVAVPKVIEGDGLEIVILLYCTLLPP